MDIVSSTKHDSKTFAATEGCIVFSKPTAFMSRSNTGEVGGGIILYRSYFEREGTIGERLAFALGITGAFSKIHQS